MWSLISTVLLFPAGLLSVQPSSWRRGCIDPRFRPRLGNIADESFAGCLESCRERLRHLGIVSHKAQKFSSYGSCADCRFLNTCRICPISIALLGENGDTRRVPDPACAFNLVAGEAASEFWGSRRSAPTPPRNPA